MSAPAPPPKLSGPYALIRKIRRRANGRYTAYDADGNFVIDLTKEGADALVGIDPFRIELVA